MEYEFQNWLWEAFDEGSLKKEECFEALHSDYMASTLWEEYQDTLFEKDKAQIARENLKHWMERAKIFE